MAYGTEADLASWMGRSAFTGDDASRATLLLDSAQATIDNEANQRIDQRTENLTLDGTNRKLLVVPVWPIVSIASITESGDALTEDDDFTWSENGVIERIGACWTSDRRAISIELTAGHDPVPDEITLLERRLAARAWDDPYDANSEQLGDRSVQWNRPTMDLTSGQARIVQKYRAHL